MSPPHFQGVLRYNIKLLFTWFMTLSISYNQTKKKWKGKRYRDKKLSQAYHPRRPSVANQYLQAISSFTVNDLNCVVTTARAKSTQKFNHKRVCDSNWHKRRKTNCNLLCRGKNFPIWTKWCSNSRPWGRQ